MFTLTVTAYNLPPAAQAGGGYGAAMLGICPDRAKTAKIDVQTCFVERS
jgi:hypothetical protein